jgi:hypothetical protein
VQLGSTQALLGFPPFPTVSGHRPLVVKEVYVYKESVYTLLESCADIQSC